MAMTDRERRAVFASFEAAHGEEVANLIMQLLPNQPTDQLVTRTDMHTFGTGLRGEMAELRAEIKGEMAEQRADVRTEMADTRSGLRTEMADVRSELRADMANLQVELKTHTTRVVVGGAIVNVLAVLGAAGLT